MLRCAITDGTASGLVSAAWSEQMREQVHRWAADGIDLIQLREKNIEAGGLFALAEAAIETLRAMRSQTKLVVNTRADVAIAAQADGVHLTSHPDELTPEQVRMLFARAGLTRPVVSVSCHTAEEVTRARVNGADFILFGPVFEKRVAGEMVREGVGMDALRVACELADPVPVLALGGVTAENIGECSAAGAAGVAGIRTFR